jgi:peroxiredoxin (alkyl hydroperoxide reductase subunit C)
MAIQAGEKFPSIKLMRWGANGPEAVMTDDLLKGKTVVLFGVPGAFTPKCSEAHLPGFVKHADAIRAKGVDAIICTAVNDVFVMHAWGKDQGVGERVLMVADGDAELTKALHVELDLHGKGLGLRNQRFAMVIKDGVVQHLAIDPPGTFDKTSAESILASL